ncbi:lipopolysaccharide assembly LapA domain-containing protein [Arthrobacter sp. GAS37]|uniref:LapA family protein n=1 Tax=Arthrobacter sp. GAS37 TaxID=3156261 RepID=UPI00384E8E30
MSSENAPQPGKTPEPSDPQPSAREAGPAPAAVQKPHVTRAAVIWSAVGVSLVVLVLLIVFFIQNQDVITVRFLGWEGRLAQGVAFFIAAVGGGILVAIAGSARILQLRAGQKRRRNNTGTGARE